MFFRLWKVSARSRTDAGSTGCGVVVVITRRDGPATRRSDGRVNGTGGRRVRPRRVRPSRSPTGRLVARRTSVACWAARPVVRSVVGLNMRITTTTTAALAGAPLPATAAAASAALSDGGDLVSTGQDMSGFTGGRLDGGAAWGGDGEEAAAAMGALKGPVQDPAGRDRPWHAVSSSFRSGSRGFAAPRRAPVQEDGPRPLADRGERPGRGGPERSEEALSGPAALH